LFVVFLPGSAPANKVNGGVVRQPYQECALFPRATQQARLPREAAEDFLEQIAGVIFVASEIKQECEQRLGVFVIKPLKVGLVRHRLYLNDAPRGKFCLVKEIF
jgi:hypothetical protein